ncbi:MAG: hypothetical protein AB7T63_15945 [Planctomycetota bacterium]
MVSLSSPHGDPLAIEVPGHVLTARPPALAGHHASLPLAQAPRPRDELAVLLHWQEGAPTELATRVAAIDDGGLVHVDVLGVSGAWQPWLAWLGHRTLGEVTP